MAKYNGNAVVKGCRACYEAETQDYDLEYSIFVYEAGLDWFYFALAALLSFALSVFRQNVRKDLPLRELRW